MNIRSRRKNKTNRTNKITRKRKIKRNGSKVCNVSNESHSKYYNFLLNAKDKQYIELKRKQKEDKSKSIEEAILKAAQEKLFKLEETKRQNEQKKLENKQYFDSKYHKSKCVCISSNNKDVVTYEIPLYQKYKNPSISECLDHKTISYEPSSERPGTAEDVFQDKPSAEKKAPLVQSTGRNRKKRFISRKKNNRKRRSKISRTKRNTQMSGGNWLTNLFKENKKDDIMKKSLPEGEYGDVAVSDALQSPSQPPLLSQESVKDKFKILEKDGVFNVVKLNKDQDGFITKRFFGGSRRKRRITSFPIKNAKFQKEKV